MSDIQPFYPHAASAAEWAEFHKFRRSRAEEDEPGEPILDDAEMEHIIRRHWPLHESRRLLARRNGTVIGSAGYSFRREGTPDYAEYTPFLQAWGGVLARERRQGIATALLRRVCEVMRDSSRTILTMGARLPEGHAFLAAIGAVEKHRSVENRMDFAGLDWDELTSWHQAAIPAGTAVPASSGLNWQIHAGRMPMDRLAALAPQFSQLLNDTPTGTLDLPLMRYELPGFTAWYEEMDRHGGSHFMVLLMHGEDVAAICEASWDARFPDRVFQALTAVARPWRGKGLAKSVKAAMLRLIREHHPQVSLMITTNADVNAAMLSINRRLGFAVHRHDGSYQITRDALAAWLAAR